MKQKNVKFSSLFAAMLLFSMIVVQNPRRNKELRNPQEGVSRELALFRKGQITDLRYDLTFSVPKEMGEALSGDAVISFNIDKKANVVLDFRGEEINSIKANGLSVEIDYRREHIIIPKSDLKRGLNTVEIEFVPGDRSLNRREEFLYTLAVPDRARTIYPCFDQPDMKALFTLRLDLPQEWEAVSNAPLRSEEGVATGDALTAGGEGRKVLTFEQTKPLSTYLFAFTAGKWQKESRMHNGKCYTAYYRETDPSKLAQLPEIFNLVFKSVDWMEDYTAISQPFQKYDFVIVPGFQFGGMEHPGSILYNDKRLFLGANPTVDQQHRRKSLIAHETSHLWFGDAVTMEWFDDVWTKEVFANYFAAKIVEDMADAFTEPVVDNGEASNDKELLKELRDFYVSAYSEDRTMGTNAVKQRLDNLKDAGLIYGQIIYNKAPIVMKYLVERLGEDAFKQGMRSYLDKYLFDNATWEGLIAILDDLTPDDLADWSNVWVNERGMAQIEGRLSDNKLIITQSDPYKRGLVWRQNIGATIINRSDLSKPVAVMKDIALEAASVEVPLEVGSAASEELLVLLNIPGGGYGRMLYSREDAEFILNHFSQLPLTKDQKLALLIDLNENRLVSRVDDSLFADALMTDVLSETEPLVLSLEIGYLKEIASHSLAMTGAVIARERSDRSNLIEQTLLSVSKTRATECGQVAFRALSEIFTTPETTREIYNIWSSRKPYEGLTLDESDYMKMAYELSIRVPERYEELVQVQSERISNPDRKREFQFVVRAVNPDHHFRDSLFESLLQPENRVIEPWTSQVLGYLNHPLRQDEAVGYILTALQELREVQRTGDIFFPKDWCSSLLRGHNTTEAGDIVTDFLQRSYDYPPLLENKILQSADHLFRIKGDKEKKN